jgi:hypothetical protein
MNHEANRHREIIIWIARATNTCYPERSRTVSLSRALCGRATQSRDLPFHVREALAHEMDFSLKKYDLLEELDLTQGVVEL